MGSWIFSFLVLLLVTGSDFNWRDQMAYGFVWAGLLVIWTKLKHYDVSLRIGFSFLLCHLFYFSFTQESPYPKELPYLPLVTDSIMLHSAVGIILAIAAVEAILKRNSEDYLVLTGFLAFVASICLVVKAVLLTDKTAFLNSDSMDSTFLAILYPIYRKAIGQFPESWKKITLHLLPIIAVLLCKSSMGLLTLCASMTAYELLSLNRSKVTKVVPILLLSLVALVCVGAYLMEDQLLNLNGRAAIWSKSMEFWNESVDWTSGSGLSTFNYFGKVIQHQHNIDLGGGRWLWMHSDWLQMLFETGVFGIATAALIFVRALYLTVQYSPMLCASVFAIGVASIGNMPFRYFPSGFVCLFILMLALKVKDPGELV